MRMALPQLVAAFVLAASPFGTTEVPVTRDGVKTTRVSANSWPGEYPSPMTHLSEQVTIPAYKSVRVLGKPQACTLKPGVYHMWGSDQGSALGYYMLYPQSRYVALREVTIQENPPKITLQKGEVLANVVPLSEGHCHATRVGPSGKAEPLTFFCGHAFDPDDLREEPAQKDPFEEKWIHLKCEEGHKAWVRAEALTKVKGAKQAQLVEYGRVEPAPASPAP